MIHINKRGFSIVELIVVIVVIAILVTVAIVSYNWMQKDAVIARRISDITQLQKSLEIYKTKHGEYPPTTQDLNCRSTRGNSISWEASEACPDRFLEPLKQYLDGKTIVDPENSRTAHYRYFRYPAGAKGCDRNRGDFYVLYAYDSKQQTPAPESPGFSCTNQNWGSLPGVVYVVADFTK